MSDREAIYKTALERMAEKELIEALRAILAIPSERTLLLNAEARAMYEIAKRALEEGDAT